MCRAIHVLLSLAVFAVASACGAGPLVLVEDARPRATIVVADKPAPMLSSHVIGTEGQHTQRYAAEELQRYIEKATGARPRGWLGSGLQETWNTLDYLADEGVEYVSDWSNDDQPYLMDLDGGRRMASVPYNTEINDLPAFHRFFQSAEAFESMMRRCFDTLYREGAEQGRVMPIALHPFVIGQPHRIWALESALDYIAGHEHVWFATGGEILDHYLASGAAI